MGNSGAQTGGIQGIGAADSTLVFSGGPTNPLVRANVGTGAGTVAAGNDSRIGSIAGVQVSGTAAAGLVPVATGPGAAQWSTPAGGGDVTGPAGATVNHLAVFDGTSGKLLKDGGPIPAGGSGDVTGPGSAVDGHVALFDGATGKTIKTAGRALPAASSSAAAALGTAAPGSATDYARADHVHPMPSAADVGAIAPAAGIVVVNHGSVAGTARPAAAVVYWIGSVAPTNATAGDLGYGW